MQSHYIQIERNSTPICSAHLRYAKGEAQQCRQQQICHAINSQFKSCCSAHLRYAKGEAQQCCQQQVCHQVLP
jgi:hypothetical protein